MFNTSLQSNELIQIHLNRWEKNIAKFKPNMVEKADELGQSFYQPQNSGGLCCCCVCVCFKSALNVFFQEGREVSPSAMKVNSSQWDQSGRLFNSVFD